jgi:hypothetical protein
MRAMSPIAHRVAREPLVHFAVIALAFFGLHTLVTEEREEAPAIVVSSAFVDELVERHTLETGRLAADADRAELVDRFVREEVLVREARRLGLDGGDVIVRRRLAQKMEFLLEGLATVEEPTEDELTAHLLTHEERWRRPGRIAFRHVFFSRDARREHAIGDAQRALAAPAIEDAGDPFLLGAEFGLESVERIEGRFGDAFAAALEALPEGAWAGPIESSYGAHLVFVIERESARAGTLDDVREEVRRDLLEARRRDAVDRDVRLLVERYDVRIEP